MADSAVVAVIKTEDEKEKEQICHADDVLIKEDLDNEEEKVVHPVCTKFQLLGAALGPTLFLIMLFVQLDAENPKSGEMLGITLWTATWWISGVVPLSVSALIPLIMIPFTGILSSRIVSGLYLNSVVFLFVGAFLVGKALEKTNLHKRIALKILVKLGGSPLSLLFAYMLVAWFVSMFASNTATTAMLLPLVRAIFEKDDDQGSGDDRDSEDLTENDKRAQAKVMRKFEKGVLIGVAYGATCGGIATIIGTAPNTVLVSQVELIFGQTISFGKWFSFGFPIALLLLLAAFALVALFYVPRGADKALVTLDRGFFRRMQEKQGAMTRDEKVVAVVELTMILLWLLRPYTINKVIGACSLGGNFTGNFTSEDSCEEQVDGTWTAFVSDGEIACGMAMLLFLVPAMSQPVHKDDNGRIVQPRILNRQDVEDLPWGLFLLFGSGFAISAGWTASGLSSVVGQELATLTELPTFGLIFVLSLCVCFLTEVASNTAISNIMIAIGAAIAVEAGINPYIILIPSTLAASLAFMLPIATPPNAVIFSTGLLKFNDMIPVGFLLNLVGVTIVSVMFFPVVMPVLDIDLDNAPSWLPSPTPEV